MVGTLEEKKAIRIPEPAAPVPPLVATRCLRCGASALHRFMTYPGWDHVCIICGRPWD